MIVISGALVLVALILLIIGVVGPDLTFVYASIAVSLVSLVFLVIGILQRRGETPAAAEADQAPAPEPAEDAEGVTAVIPTQGRGSSRKVTEEPPVAETVEEELETGGTVLVVEGRPRYHVDGCRYLSGKDPEAVDVLDAREEGFTPCGVCRPDEALVEDEADDEDEAPEDDVVDDVVLEDESYDDEAPEDEVVEEDVPGVEVAPPARRAAKAPAKKATSKRAPAAKTTAARTAPTRAVGAAPSRTAPPPAKAPRKAAAKASGKAAAAAVAATPAAGAAQRAGSVVVIPDRGKYHRGECRYVRDVDEAEVLSKTAARRQGYAACGVCKP